MKIQCNCGAKYAFDVTPDMVTNPIQLVCQNCGADNSAGVNELIRHQFATTADIAPAAPPPSPAGARAPLRVNVHTAAPAASAAPAVVSAAQPCLKHPGQFTSDHCRVCNKPICPQCMALFGLVCSAYCKNEAESRGIDVPVYEQQSSRVRARHSRKIGRVILGIVGSVALLLGVYSWYLFSASKPRVVFSAPFQTPAYSGSGKLIGQEAVLLHGGYLARYDLKTKREVWSVSLIDTNRIAAEAEEAYARERSAFEEWKNKRTGDDMSSGWTPRSKSEIYPVLLAAAQDDFALYVRDNNVWLRAGEKLVQYDWDSGKAGKEIALSGHVDRASLAQSSLLLFSETDTGESLTRVDLISGESATEQLTQRPSMSALISNQLALASAARRGATNRPGVAVAASTAVRTNQPALAQRGTAANPALKGYKVSQPDPLPVRIAAPAIAAHAVRNAQIERALKDEETALATMGLGGPEKRFVNDRGQLVEVSVKLLESKTIQRQAMKAPPKKSALDGEVNQAATAAIANEILNEFQRDSTGGIEEEDASRYEVTIKRPSAQGAEWKGEVTGRPEFFPLESVDVLVAGKSLTVLDKAGKKLWESKLNYEIAEGFGEEGWGELVATAKAPATERDGHLYFFDKGVLACFELATGNARWRQPTVGVTKLLFDEKGMLYVDTTTGSAENLKYSQQIDISDKSYPVILKLEAKTGKILWRSERNGRLSHVFGKLIYTIEWHGGDEDEEPGGYKLGIEVPPHIRLRCLSASKGEPKWEYYQKRAPLNVEIQGNTIQLVFKKEMQVLKFMYL